MNVTPKLQTFYVTKYALTDGRIQEVTAAVIASGNMIRWEVEGYPQYASVEGKEWHRTREAAVARVEYMRMKRIASLRKQIAKLETFTLKP